MSMLTEAIFDVQQIGSSFVVVWYLLNTLHASSIEMDDVLLTES